jgi:hypothetical protein
MSAFNSTSLIPFFVVSDSKDFKILEWINVISKQFSLFGMFELIFKVSLLSINIGLYGYILSNVFLYVCKIRVQYEFKDFVNNIQKTSMESIREIRESIKESLMEDMEDMMEENKNKASTSPTLSKDENSIEKNCPNVEEANNICCTSLGTASLGTASGSEAPLEAMEPVVQETGETRCFRNPCPNIKKLNEDKNGNNLIETIYEDTNDKKKN